MEEKEVTEEQMDAVITRDPAESPAMHRARYDARMLELKLLYRVLYSTPAGTNRPSAEESAPSR